VAKNYFFDLAFLLKSKKAPKTNSITMTPTRSIDMGNAGFSSTGFFTQLELVVFALWFCKQYFQRLQERVDTEGFDNSQLP